MSERTFPWSTSSLTDDEYEDCVVIQIFVDAYGLGYTYSEKKFKFFNDFIGTTEEFDIKSALSFLQSFESRYGNEVWFQLSDSASRRKALAKRVQSSEGEQ